MQQRKRALILKFGQIGDVIMAIPAARALYDAGYDVDWACGKAALPLVQCYSWIRPIPVDDKAILRGSVGARLVAISSLWRMTLPTRYDLCATLYYDRRFRVLAAPIRAGRKIMLSHHNRETALIPGRHHTDEFVRVLMQIEDGWREQSTAPVPPDINVACPLPARTKARRIGIVPGGTSNVLGEQTLRRWQIDNYVALTRHLVARGWEVLLLGGKEDEWTRPYFGSLEVTDCIGSYSLTETLSICGDCDAVICHDTGPLHLAGLTDTVLIGVFGSTDPATRIPRRPFASGIWGGEGFACRPCYDGSEFAPCRFNGCMQQVTPEMVLQELDRLLGARTRGEVSPWRISFPSSFARELSQLGSA